ncbi:MAG: CheR family methyltransferase [Chthoniobacteraceae bacterium]
MPEQAEHPEAVFATLKQMLVESTGLSYYSDRDAELRSMFTRRQMAVGARDLAAYLHLVRDSAAAQTEMDLLVEEATIGETYFFRHSELFDALRTVALPAILERNQPHRQLRIWSAGCSIGAELYTLSIILRSEFAAKLEGWNVQLVGTDINRDFLRRARAGRFAEWALRNVPMDIRERYFTRAGREWQIKLPFKQNVTFQHHNLVTHPFPSVAQNLFGFDLILCRNVMIYFDRPTVQRIIHDFGDSLVHGGWLAVGHAEPSMELFADYEVVLTKGASLYCKSGRRQVISRILQPIASTPAPAAPVPQKIDLASIRVPEVKVEEEKVPVSKEAAAPAPPTELQTMLALADAGDLAAAAEHCRRLIDRDRLNPHWYFHYALFVDQLGQPDVAREGLQRAIYLDRKFALAHYHLGLLEQRAGRTGARELRNAVNLLTPMTDDALLSPGDALTAGDLREMARAALELAEA